MKDKEILPTFKDIINIQVAVRLWLIELIENKAKYTKSLGKKSANLCYNPMIKATIAAYRATKKIPFSF